MAILEDLPQPPAGDNNSNSEVKMDVKNKSTNNKHTPIYNFNPN
jgi:hypothetical protein